MYCVSYYCVQVLKVNVSVFGIFLFVEVLAKYWFRKLRNFKIPNMCYRFYRLRSFIMQRRRGTNRFHHDEL